MDVEGLSEISGLPVEERIKVLTAAHASGNDTIVNTVIDRLGAAELKELATHAIQLLADARLALAAMGGK